MKNVVLKSPRATQSLAKKISSKILISGHKKHAAVVALTGELGAGKTTFAQGFAKALGVKQRLVSPTFVIFRRYVLKLSFPPRNGVRGKLQRESSMYKYLYHVDAYRIKSPKEILSLGFKKILSDPKNIVLIEWAENIKKVLPKDALWLNFFHGNKPNSRIVSENS